MATTNTERMEVVEQASSGIPVPTYIYQLLESFDGSLIASDGSNKKPHQTEYDMSEVRTTNPYATYQLLDFSGFRPNLYRVTYRDQEVNLEGNKYDYSIGYLPPEEITKETTDVDELIGVSGSIPGTPPEAEKTLRKLDINNIIHTTPEYKDD